jgi:hypothetical protein
MANKKLTTYLNSVGSLKTKAESLGLFNKDGNKGDFQCYEYKRIEPRTRQKDSTFALSMPVYDPLWTLARQWQFGEFQGNDCGSVVKAQITMKKTKFSHVKFNNATSPQSINKDGGWKAYDKETDVLEYRVERLDELDEHKIAPLIRIESALHFKRWLKSKYSDTIAAKILTSVRKDCPLDNFAPDYSRININADGKELLEEAGKSVNTKLEQYWETYGTRLFDGYKLYKNGRTIAGYNIQEYLDWFKQTYLPSTLGKGGSCWSSEQLGYDMSIKTEDNTEYVARDYHSGRLSWYSFDEAVPAGKDTEPDLKTMTFLPVLADFPGTPNKRLWQFEDANVNMGNIDMDYNSVANAVVLQYTTMYGNDWMLVPMELEVGTLMKVTKINITNTFGDVIKIENKGTGVPNDNTVPYNNTDNIPYTSRWSLFEIAKENAYSDRDFSTNPVLFYPPSLARTVESKPIETVQFLRDEMSNMLWGVEKVIDDGLGSTLDGDSYASNIISIVDDVRDKAIEDAKKTGTISAAQAEKSNAEYSFVLQNRVPLNWIPFVPQKYKFDEENLTENFEREIRFRRATMPIYINDGYQRIRPFTSLLAVKKNEKGQIVPHYVNEEEILAVGTKISLNHQRTRWFNGKTFNWLGAKKEISQTMGNSGLQQDELTQNITEKDFNVDKTKNN